MWRWISVSWAWLQTHNESIVSLASAVQAIAIVAAVYQISLTKTQIEDARHSLEASVELQLQHDGRDILGSLTPDLYNYIYDNQPLRPEPEREAQKKIAQLLNFYSSVSRESGIGALGAEYWDAARKEFCFFIQHDHVRPMWESAVARGAYVPAFVEIGSLCLRKAAPSP